jgi:hypothetical protein
MEQEIDDQQFIKDLKEYVEKPKELLDRLAK